MLRFGCVLLLVSVLPVSGAVRGSLKPGLESRREYKRNNAAGVCNQSSGEQKSIITEAESQKFTVRRVEFLGLTYTRDQVVRDRMTPLVNEGDLFSQMNLVKSLQRMSKLRAIYPLKMKDVFLRVDRTNQEVDMTICFKQRQR